MDASRLMPESIDGEKKQKAVQDAKDMYQRVVRTCERANTSVPPYEFIELTGKGQYGRVYKCRARKTGDLVAIKILNTDDIDYQENILDKDNTIRDFRKEVTILQQLKDNKAKNINMIHDAFDLQDQLWIISEYCTGGSVRTLMRAQPASSPGLEEQYIIPIARELALAMKSVHDIDIIHRDIKCSNTYITEEGEIQLGDFGIVGIMDDGDGASKRRTMIGTPHYMPPQMHVHGPGNTVAEAYGKEVDIWSFGCSVYEMATGLPPNARVHVESLPAALRSAPRLVGGNHSQELRDLVAFCLNPDSTERPTADEVLKHPYLANTQKRYPTRKLVELIHRFKAWEYSGGWRQSLFYAGGAPPVSGTGEQDTSQEMEDDWNFSTSDSFNADFERRYSQMVATQTPKNVQFDTNAGSTLHPLITNLTPLERARKQHHEISANRGERSLVRLFTPDSAPYELHAPVEDMNTISDLPFRNLASGPSRESQVVIDLDTAGSAEDSAPTFNFDFGDIPTLKARTKSQPAEEEEDGDYEYGGEDDGPDKRATMDWKFPKRATMDWKFPKTAAPAPRESDDDLPKIEEGQELAPGFRPILKHTTTEPIGQFRDYMHPMQGASVPPASLVRDSMSSMIDLDLADDTEIMRPSTASSATGSTMSAMTSGNPFDLEEDPEQNEMDRNRFSSHKPWLSEGGQMKRSSRRSVPMHNRGSSLSSSASDLDRSSTTDDDDVFDYGYNRGLSESMRQRLNGTLPDDDTNIDHWPDFGIDSGFDRVRGYTDDLDEMVRREREFNPSQERAGPVWPPSSRATPTEPEQREIEFPPVIPPHMAALVEDADPRTVMAEMSRLLDDFSDGLAATANALLQYAGLDDEDGLSVSESESGMDTTGDEEGY